MRHAKIINLSSLNRFQYITMAVLIIMQWGTRQLANGKSVEFRAGLTDGLQARKTDDLTLFLPHPTVK